VHLVHANAAIAREPGQRRCLSGEEVSVDDVQQEEPDQEVAFQKAFSLELVFTSLFTLAALVAIPVIAVVYGQTRIVLPALIAVADDLAGVAGE